MTKGESSVRVFVIILTFLISFLSLAQDFVSVRAANIVNTFGYMMEHPKFADGDEVKGLMTFKNGLTIVAGASVTFDTHGKIFGPLNLEHGIGEIALSSDLTLGSSVSLPQGGCFNGNGYSFVLTGSLVVPTNRTLRITGNTIINGNGNILKLEPDARLVIDNNATLTLKNMHVRNTGNNNANPIIRVVGHDGKLALQNVDIALANEWIFRDGQLFIHDDVVISGSTFSYRSTQPGHIDQGACLMFEKDAEFFYYPSTGNRDLLSLDGDQACLFFDGATLQATHTGLRLTKGTVYFDNSVTLSSAANTKFDSISLATGADQGTTGSVHAVDWNPNGRFIALASESSGGGHDELEIYNFNESSLSQIISQNYGTRLNTVKWTPDGGHVAIGGYGPALGHAKVEAYSFDGQLLSGPMLNSKYGTRVNAVAWHPTGKLFAIGGIGPTCEHEDIEIYSFYNGVFVGPIVKQDYGITVNAVAWSPDGQYLAAAGKKNIDDSSDEIEVYSFDMTASTLSLEATHDYEKPTDFIQSVDVASLIVRALDWHPHGTYLAVGGMKKFTPSFPGEGLDEVEVYSFDGSTLTQVATQDFDVFVNEVSWSHRGQHLAIGGRPLWWLSGGVPVKQTHRKIDVYFFDGLSLTLTASRAPLVFPGGFSWSPDDTYIAAGIVTQSERAGSLNIYELDTTNSDLIRTNIDRNIPSMTAVNSVSWHPSLDRIVVGGENITMPSYSSYKGVVTKLDMVDITEKVIVYDFGRTDSSLKKIQSIDYGYSVGEVAWSPDGNYVLIGGGYPAVGHDEIEVQKFDGAEFTRQTIRRQPYGQTDEVHAVAWSLDGKYLAVGGWATTSCHEELELYEFTGSRLEKRFVQSYNVPVYSLSFSPNGDRLIVGLGDNTSHELYVYPFVGTNTATDLNALGSDIGATVYVVDWTPDGKNLAVGLHSGANKEIRVYSFDGTSLSDLNALSSDIGANVNALAWNYDGSRLAVGLDDDANKEVRVYSFDGYDLKDLDVLPADVGFNVLSLDWIPTGTCVAVGFASSSYNYPSGYSYLDRELRVYSFDGSNLTDLVALPDIGDSVNSVSWSSSGQYLAVGLSSGANKEVRVYSFDGSSLTGLDSLPSDISASVKSVAWSPDDKYLAVALFSSTYNSELRVYSFDGSSLTDLGVLAIGPMGVATAYSVAWSPDGKSLAVGFGSPEYMIRVYSFDGTSLIDRGLFPTSIGTSVYSVSWSPDGLYLAAGLSSSARKEVRVYSFMFSDFISAEMGATVRSSSWSPDGNYLVVGLERGAMKEIRVYSFDGTNVTDLDALASDLGVSVWSVAWSPDGNYILAGSHDSPSDEIELYKFNGTSLARIDSENYGTFVNSISWSPDGNYFAVGGYTPDTGHNELDVYKVKYTWDTGQQDLTHGITFGNSSESNCDVNMQVLGGAQVEISGLVHDDSV